ncbi:putative bifunctional diguanylate cyclase/phosphodiesterase [Rhodococcoides kyotonense]|nr:bifunctional diguanylate cyclase/phosphodiesterase [Rhodococcus kyotonensis]
MAWSRFMLAGLACVAGYSLLPDGVGRVVLYGLVAIGSVAVFLLRGRVRRRHDGVMWVFLAVGLMANCVGDAVVELGHHGGRSASGVSVADALYVVGHVAFVAAVLTVRDHRGRVVKIEDVLEGLIVATGVGLVSWVFLVGHDSVGNPGPDSVATHWPAVLYPTTDGFLVATALILLVSKRARTGPFVIVTLAMSVFAVSNWVAYGGFDGSGQVMSGLPVSNVAATLSLVAYVLLAAYSANPTPHGSPSTGTEKRLFADRTRLLGLSAASLMAPVVMGIQLAGGVPVSKWGWVVAGCSMLVVALVGARMACFLTVMRRQAAELTETAMSDSVTGLPNRRRIGEMLDRAVDEAGEQGIIVLIVDIDRFAQINETFGYPVGDSVLREIGERLVGAAVTDAVVGRLGGDQFVVAIPAQRMPVTAAECAEHFQRAVSRTMFVHDINVALEATVGVVHSAKDPGVGAETLLQHAHVALTAAKAGHMRVSIYMPTMDCDRRQQMRLLGELETALLHRQLRVYFQPCLDLDTRRVTRIEALLRWQHPREGLIAPSSFLPDAERTGMLPAISAYVLEDSLACCSALRRKGFRIGIAVNLSVRNLVDPTLGDQVAAALERHDVPASAVEFEVTETSAMTDPRRSVDALVSLRDLGASIAIDDYGTGYSSLAYLRSLPVQTLKIDRSFVTAMNSQPTNASIVRSTIELGRSLGMTVVAEGVEDKSTLDRLHVLGCDGAQGYHIGRAVPADELQDLIERIEGIEGRSSLAHDELPAVALGSVAQRN